MNTRLTVYRGGKIALIFCIGLLFTGCMKMTQTFTIHEDGTVSIVAIEDMSAMAEAQEDSLQVSQEELNCDDMSMEEIFTLSAEETCDVSEDGFIKQLTTEAILEDDEFQAQDGYFKYEKSYDLSDEESESDPEESSAKEMMQMAKAMGVVYVWEIIMPGEVIATNQGSFVENTVTIDLLSQDDSDFDVIILSKKESATGEIPWDIPATFITEPGEAEVGGDTALFLETMEAMKAGEIIGFGDEMGEASSPAAEESEDHTIRIVAPEPEEYKASSSQNSDLPASGGENVFVLLWKWIVSLF